MLGTGVYVSRVASDENLADLPSREEYGLLARLGAVRVEPFLDDKFNDPGSWEALSLPSLKGFRDGDATSVAEQLDNS